MTDKCPKCGWVVDYSCGCPDGKPTFPLVDDYDDWAVICSRGYEMVRQTFPRHDGAGRSDFIRTHLKDGWLVSVDGHPVMLGRHGDMIFS